MTAILPPLDLNHSKEQNVLNVFSHLSVHGLRVAEIDASRPWGAFFRIPNSQADQFIKIYFNGADVPETARHGERSPKLLLVAPHQRLSWQYHDRRAEYWRTIEGTVGVAMSETDTPPSDLLRLPEGATVSLAQGTRHRLVGLNAWGVVAEIWIHTDPANPSNEQDLYRLQDDYARN
jgi:mannose-6-phosphate isomerase